MTATVIKMIIQRWSEPAGCETNHPVIAASPTNRSRCERPKPSKPILKNLIGRLLPRSASASPPSARHARTCRQLIRSYRVHERIGLDGKTRKLPEKKQEPEKKPDEEADDDDTAGLRVLDYDGLLKEYEKLQTAHRKLERKQLLAKDDDEDCVSVQDWGPTGMSA